MNYRIVVYLCIIFAQISIGNSNLILKNDNNKEVEDEDEKIVATRFDQQYCQQSGCEKYCENIQRCCHCSPPPSACFSAKALVHLENGEYVTMSELQIGDRVQTVSPSGRIIYSTVNTFLKKQPAIINKYKSIATSRNNTIRLSGNHLIYSRKVGTDRFNPIYAEKVANGDEILVNGNDKLVPRKVTDTSSFIMEGAYVPLTREGNIMVDKILASCYPSADHDLAHFGMTPLRFFPRIIEWIFGKVKDCQPMSQWVTI